MRHRSLLLALALLSVPGIASAFPVINYNKEYTGGTLPGGAAPWLRATLSSGGTGIVDIKLEALSLLTGEFVSKVGLNLADSFFTSNGKAISALSWSVLSAKTGAFNNPSLSVKKDGFNGGGGAKFDIGVEFSTSSGASKRFTSGDAVTIRFKATGLSVSAFDLLSTGSKKLISAAHVQGTGPKNDKSAWVTALLVPEPSTLAIAGLGALGFLGYGARRRSWT